MVNKKQYKALSLPEKLLYYNKQTKNRDEYSCLICETIAYDYELYHVKDVFKNGILVCYKLTDNGWNDKNKTYYLKRKDVIFCENIPDMYR